MAGGGCGATSGIHIWDLVLSGAVELAAVDSCKPGLVYWGQEASLSWCDLSPRWDYYRRRPWRLEALERALEADLLEFSTRHRAIVYYVDVKAYRLALEAERLASRGLLEWSPRLPGDRRLLGLGGLDGPRRRISYIASLLEEVESRLDGVSLHLFGVGARILAGLARRGLLDLVYSVDSSGWLAEIRFRRRTHYRAPGVVEANAAAMRGYLARLARILGGG